MAEIEENHQTQKPLWLLNNTFFCYDGQSPTKNGNDKKTSSFSITKNIKITNKFTELGQRAQEHRKKFAKIFLDITRRGALSVEASIYKAEMTAIKIALKEIYKRVLYSPSNITKKIAAYYIRYIKPQQNAKIMETKNKFMHTQK